MPSAHYFERTKARRYTLALGLKIGARALRATAATNTLDHEAAIAKVQEWLGHANIATTRIYDRRKMKPEYSPTSKLLGHHARGSPLMAGRASVKF